MPENSIAGFTRLINTQINAHEDLTQHLAQIEDIFEFMLTTNLNEAKPTALQAQLLSVDKLIHEAKAMNEALHATLVDKALAQIADTEKQS
jgi:hypothetical protein